MLRFFCTTLLAVLAVAAQSAVVVMLLPSWPHESVSMLDLLGWQLIAALSAALAFSCGPAGKSRDYRRGVFIHAFCLCAFLPIAGQVMFLCMRLAPRFFPYGHHDVDIHTIDKPEFMPLMVSRIAYGSGARLKARLDNLEASDEDRVAAMVAMRSLPLHMSDGMLRDLLSDPLEEIRLLAYGISNAAESAVTQRILEASRQMDVSTSASEQARLRSVLAELHWELIYQNLVHGELRRHSLERVERYAHASLAMDENNAAMWYLLGRCALLNKEPLRAEVFLKHAQDRHFPPLSLLPWLAEAAFMKREYEHIDTLLAPLHGGAIQTTMQPTVRYWTQ